jgi:K+-sensing histidine kinase KdpD
MRIQNSKSWVKYSFGDAVLGSVVLLLGAFVVRYALQPWIEPYAPFHFFIVACLFIAYLYGYKLALLSTLISALAGSFFFVKPYFTLGPTAVSDVIQFINFTSVTAISVVIIEKLQRTIYARRMVLKIMESRHKISLYRENDRIYFSKSNNEAWAVLDEILTDFDDLIFIQYGSASVKLEPLFMALTDCQKPILSSDEWQSLMHPDDLGLLLSKLSQPITKSGQMDEFELRFALHEGTEPHRVALEFFVFLGKPLRILRLTASRV